MRVLSISGGILFAAAISLVGGSVLRPNLNAEPTKSAAATQRGEVPRIVLQAMSWWYFSAQVSRAQLPAQPSAHFRIIDLRQPEDFARDHLAGAVNIPADQIIAQLGGVAPDHEQPILLYGYDETHSVRSLATLRLLAYTHVMHLKDGWPDNGAALNANATKAIAVGTTS